MLEDDLINCLPSEILEYIIGLVSPYEDLESCKLVCKKWSEIVKDVIHKHKTRFLSSITNIAVQWENLPPSQDLFTSITRRYSHAACSYKNSMYVFGGCTSTNTTFNDLWKLNLSTRSWVRPLPIGSYPSPKACATLVLYKDSLFLYGGWAQSNSSPMHQVCQLFNELNIYRLKTNKWDYEYTHPPPPAAAGHSATVHRDQMIVFGGIRRQLSSGHPSQDILCYNLENNSWSEPTIDEPKPQGRYGQTQVVLDDEHLLIIGGCGGPNSIFNDVWLLSMTELKWRWKELTVEGKESSACHMWCSPGCKVDNLVVFLCRNSNTPTSSPHPTYASHYNMSSQIRGRSVWVPPVENNADIPHKKSPEERNLNGHKGTLPVRQREEKAAKENNQDPTPAGRVNHRAGSKPSIRPNAMKNRGKQLEALKQMEERIQRLKDKSRNGTEDKASAQSSSSGVMSLCVLDVSQAITHSKVRWLPASSTTCTRNSPEESVLYTMVRGRGELVVFGGVQKFISTEATTNTPMSGGPNIVSNAVYFIKAPQLVV